MDEQVVSRFRTKKLKNVKWLVTWHLSHTHKKKWNLSQVLFQNQNYQILQPSKYRGKISELKMREFKCHLKLRQTDNICKRSSLSWSNIFEGKKKLWSNYIPAWLFAKNRANVGYAFEIIWERNKSFWLAP